MQARGPAPESLLCRLVCACALLLPAAPLLGQAHFAATPAAWGRVRTPRGAA